MTFFSDLMPYHKELMNEDEEREIEEILKSRVMGYDDLNALSERLTLDLIRLESVHSLSIYSSNQSNSGFFFLKEAKLLYSHSLLHKIQITK
jgi:hypothetical protein